MKNYMYEAYDILSKVYRDGAYLNIAMGGGMNEMTTYLVYGVLEDDVRLDYIVSEVTDRRPKKRIEVLLKIGIYALINVRKVPKPVIVSECVECSKMLKMSGLSGFVNAVLKKVARGEFAYPKEEDKNYLSVKYSKPQWFIDKLTKEYGKDVAEKILSAKSPKTEHARVNQLKTTKSKVKDRLNAAGVEYKESEVGGLILRNEEEVKKLFADGSITFQAASSMLAVQALDIKGSDRVLDLCSAPGGKAVYAAEFARFGEVVSADINAVRLNLIRKYCHRMNAKNVKVTTQDATLLNEEWVERFDCVIADVPCSCFGTFLKHPDVFLQKGEDEFKDLPETQLAILKNAAKYVKKGGKLLYSTCTLFKEENGDVISEFLRGGGFILEHVTAAERILGGEYKDNDGSLQILPSGEYDGFYLARLKKL